MDSVLDYFLEKDQKKEVVLNGVGHQLSFIVLFTIVGALPGLLQYYLEWSGFIWVLSGLWAAFFLYMDFTILFETPIRFHIIDNKIEVIKGLLLRKKIAFDLVKMPDLNVHIKDERADKKQRTESFKQLDLERHINLKDIIRLEFDFESNGKLVLEAYNYENESFFNFLRHLKVYFMEYGITYFEKTQKLIDQITAKKQAEKELIKKLKLSVYKVFLSMSKKQLSQSENHGKLLFEWKDETGVEEYFYEANILEEATEEDVAHCLELLNTTEETISLAKKRIEGYESAINMLTKNLRKQQINHQLQESAKEISSLQEHSLSKEMNLEEFKDQMLTLEMYSKLAEEMSSLDNIEAIEKVKAQFELSKN